MTHGPRRSLRVALVSTAAADAPGSMRSYTESVLHSLSGHAPEIECELIELEPVTPKSRMRQRWRTLSQPLRAHGLRQRPDLWHVLDSSRAFLASFLPGAPFVLTVHDIIPWLQDTGRFPGQPRLGEAARAWWKGNARAMRRASMLVCVSQRTASDVESAFQISPERCRVLPLPLRPSMAASSLAAPAVERPMTRILHVGNNASYKNRAGALRIFSRIDSTLGTELVMAGPAPGPDLLRMAAALGVEARVHWMTDPDDAQLARLYRESTLLLFPSIYEGFGWPVLEAMAFGLPVVASAVGYLPELLGDTSPVLGPGEDDAFVRKCEELLRSREALAEASTRGRARAAKFTLEEFGAGLANCYREAAGGTVGSLR